MQLTKSLSLVAVIVLLFLCCSCDKGGSNKKTEISPPDKSLVALASTTYEEAQLLEIASFSGTMDELNKKYPIECLREDKGMYRVSYLGNGSIAVLLFDNSGNRLWGKRYPTLLLKSDFDTLEKGDALKEVREIDPDGEYLFLYTGRNDAPRVSSHCTKDGYLITIEYDASNVIIGISRVFI